MTPKQLQAMLSDDRFVIKDTAVYPQQFNELHENPNFIGSSKIPTIAGLNPWKSPFELWCEETGKTKKAEGDQDLFWFGHEMEPIIGRLAERKGYGSTLAANAVIRHQDHPWAVASPDFLLFTDSGEVEILEAKNTGWWARDDWAEDKAPDYAHVQIQWQLFVLGIFKAARVAGLIGGDPRSFVCPRFEADSCIQAALLQKAKDYRACVETNTPPDVSGPDIQTICDVFPGLEGETIELDEQAGALIKERDEIAKKLTDANANAKAIKALKDDLEAKLALMLGDAQAGVFEGRQVAKKLVQRKGYEVKPTEYWTISITNYKG